MADVTTDRVAWADAGRAEGGRVRLKVGVPDGDADLVTTMDFEPAAAVALARELADAAAWPASRPDGETTREDLVLAVGSKVLWPPPHHAMPTTAADGLTLDRAWAAARYAHDVDAPELAGMLAAAAELAAIGGAWARAGAETLMGLAAMARCGTTGGGDDAGS